MRRAVLALLAALAVAGPSWALSPGVEQTLLKGGSASRVQGAVAFAGNNTTSSFSVAFFPIRRGGAIAIYTCIVGSNPTKPTVADNLGNAYTVVATGIYVARYSGYVCWGAYRTNSAGGETSVTVTYPVANTYAEIIMDELKGVSVFDGYSQAGTTSTTTLATGSWTTTGNDLIWSAGQNMSQNAEATFPPGFNVGTDGMPNAALQSAWRTGVPAAPQNVTWTIPNASSPGVSVIGMAFR